MMSEIISEIVIAGAILYFAFINIFSALLAYIDKKNAEKNKWRIPESILMACGFLGGAAGEYFMMKKIRHKTKHGKFMIGLPLECTLHIVLLILIISKVAA